MASTARQPVTLPRVTITYCTQCRWLLRAAYFAQELLSTFSTSLGEVSLVPATGGLFTVSLTYRRDATVDADTDAEADAESIDTVLLWDRKSEGGFPETKVLKQRVRDCIDPKRDLGHSDIGGKKNATITNPTPTGSTGAKVEETTLGEVLQVPQGEVKQTSQGEGSEIVAQNDDCQDCK